MTLGPVSEERCLETADVGGPAGAGENQPEKPGTNSPVINSLYNHTCFCSLLIDRSLKLNINLNNNRFNQKHCFASYF